jgi:tetratricopeptide (TPR) repeat protein
MQVRSFIRFTALALVVAFTAPVFAADDASMHQVYLAAEAGKFNEAQSMMDKVLRDHPNSAKAHYVEAELKAKQGQFSDAQDELNTAERLQPGLPFAKPQALQKLKSQISSTHSSSQAATQSMSNQGYQSSSNSGTPWGVIFLMIGLIAFIYFAAKWITRRNQPLIPANNYPGNGNVNPQPYAGNAAPMMAPGAGGGMGSGLMGSLATGAALGAGMVAGEALMHHFTDGEHSSNGLINDAQANNGYLNQGDMGGSDFGIADSSSWDDSSSGDDWS